MGHVKIDLSQKERSLEAKYPALDNPAGLRILLSDYHALINRQYQGDYDAVVLLADLRKAVQLAGLTARQSEALHLVYEEDLTQEEAGRRMGGLARDAVNHLLDRAIESISDIYYYWSHHGEGYVINGGL
ncbi:RNA polymerase subunit sigma [Bacillus sp. AFS073361]|uniref:sigma factor-like helix-turn-helix DNA-binding protein n=1 Tax=Bacillus sp. AFS073361 TaxID=2033511 RepID=UPI000BFA3CD5|nr:sigma factor-like helix-turn-helix DNA-binding protein [Bacillus sp. AFS073361]PFP30241.1 RNA polymerase subunit sigma [Bacillus sp. AFS073361]